jgi:hypothetical protein
MHLALYTISPAGDGWTVMLNHQDMDASVPLPTAIEAAVRAAFSAYQQGYDAHVMLCNGQALHTLWLNGDPPAHGPPNKAVSLQEYLSG